MFGNMNKKKFVNIKDDEDFPDLDDGPAVKKTKAQVGGFVIKESKAMVLEEPIRPMTA